jgi:two-component system, sensor histidine kinase and response regulator
MPEMDGFELAELMRGADRTRHVPIIFVTAGNRDPKRVFKGYESGAVDFLYKPIEPHILRGKADVFFNLHKQQRDLANALRLNEMFVGILGHDLRNPLAAMMAGAQLLEYQLTDEKYLSTVNRISASGQRMANMIDQLLDLTRARLADGMGLVETRCRVDMATLVQQTIDELRAVHSECEIKLEIHGDCSGWGDADRLLQLFSNLIANAIHHGTRGTPVNVRVNSAGSSIVLTIANQGVIPQELLPHLFDPFRSRKGSSSTSKGLGLGLFISQQIVMRHGGDIRVESTEEGGTVFTVRLPARAGSDAG